MTEVGVACVVLVIGGLLPCLIGVLRGEPLDQLAGLEALSAVTTGTLLLLAAAFNRPAYVDVALVVALLGFAGSLVFARFFGRSL